jgi:hypothetical protein
MPKHLLRPLLIVEFLIALESIYTAWSEVGGQYHLDLMYWPWKLGVGFGAAWLITLITGNIVENGGAITRRVYIYASLLCLVVATAGAVTWYYHNHEPVDQQDQQDDDNTDDSVTPAVYGGAVRTPGPGKHPGSRLTARPTLISPGAAGFSVADHRQAFLTAEGRLKFRHIRHDAVDAITRG